MRSMRRCAKSEHVPEPSLEQLQTQLLAYQLAADDMSQAIAAAIALRAEEDDRNLMLALECAMAVCYMRAFTKSTLMTMPNRFVPSVERGYSEQDADLHKWFDDRRDTAYAHTDRESGRSAAVFPLEGDPLGAHAWHLGWPPFPRDWINPAIVLFQRQMERFRAKALELQEKIEAFGPLSGPAE
jgi:hypothetical protein